MSDEAKGQKDSKAVFPKEVRLFQHMSKCMKAQYKASL